MGRRAGPCWAMGAWGGAAAKGLAGPSWAGAGCPPAFLLRILRTSACRRLPRPARRFVCPGSMYGLALGFDGTPLPKLSAEASALLRKFEALLARFEGKPEEAIEALDNA